MSTAAQGVLQHMAFRVKAIDPQVTFFKAVCDMDIRMQSDAGGVRQVWLTGGLQLVEDPAFDGPEGRFAHLGIFVDDLDAAIDAAHALGAVSLPQGRNWLKLDDGPEVELLQAAPGSVAQALGVDFWGA